MSTSLYQTTCDVDVAAAPISALLLARLMGLHPQSIDLSLDRIERLLEALGSPERQLPPVVHVAGTNGKGSLIAFLRAISEGRGCRVHSYISPHLVSFHERIVLADEAGAAPISEDALVDYLSRVEDANGGRSITHFEITTAAAFLAFSEAPADLLLLETGLGGRLDATNVVERPKLTVITPISIDHVSFLGGTIAAIAREKAGIIKPGVPCIVGRQHSEALAVIAERAKAVGAPLYVFGRDFDVSVRDGRLLFQSQSRLINLPVPRLAGAHQIENAALAIAAACVLFDENLSVCALERGLREATWPARFQRLDDGDLSACVSSGTELLLDGGHNPAAACVIGKALDELAACDPRDVHLIWGMMEAKDAQSVIAPFRGRVSRVYTVPIPDEPNAFSAADLAGIASREGFDAIPTSGVVQALRLSQAGMRPPGRVLIFGSLYLAGHVLRTHGHGLLPLRRAVGLAASGRTQQGGLST